MKSIVEKIDLKPCDSIYMSKRLQKELVQLINTQKSRPFLDNFFIVSPESTLDFIKVLIKAPFDTVYTHKFIRLNFNIPEDYPYSPPTVYFVNHDKARIHPNIGEREDGKCCSTILNTWGNNIYEKWTSSMSIESVIIGFASLLDNNPYAHEPGGRGDDSYTSFVLHQTWYTCLFEYLDHEQDEFFYTFINEYIQRNIFIIMRDIDILSRQYQANIYNTKCYEIGDYEVDYEYIKVCMDYYYKKYYTIDFNETTSVFPIVPLQSSSTEQETCSICYDTREYLNDFTIKLQCGHTFHLDCLEFHLKKNPLLCPMCRRRLEIDEYKLVIDEYVASNSSGKRYKKTNRTYSNLVSMVV